MKRALFAGLLLLGCQRAPEPAPPPPASAPARPAAADEKPASSASETRGIVLPAAPPEPAVLPPPSPKAPDKAWTTWRKVELRPGKAPSDPGVPLRLDYEGRKGAHRYRLHNGLPWGVRAVLTSPDGRTWDVDIPAQGTAELLSGVELESLSGQVWAWVAPEETYLVSQEEGILFEDDFDGNRSGWAQTAGKRGSGHSVGIRDGKLEVRVTRDRLDLFCPFTPAGSRNLSVEAVFLDAGSDRRARYGLFFGGKASGDRLESRYTFLVDGNGQYYVREISDGEWSNLIGNRRSAAIRKTKNRLEVVVSGDWVGFYINGWLVHDMTIRDFTGDRLGFIFTGGIQVDVDSIVVRSLAAGPAPPRPPTRSGARVPARPARAEQAGQGDGDARTPEAGVLRTPSR